MNSFAIATINTLWARRHDSADYRDMLRSALKVAKQRRGLNAHSAH